MNYYQGKKLLITGVTSGIGLALTELAIDKGATVLGIARNESKLIELQNRFGKLRFNYQCFDVADKHKWINFQQATEEVPEIVILNAGTCEYMDNGRVDSGLVERIIRTNFLANVYAAEALLGSFSDRIAHWCVVSSSASFLPMPRGEAYGASKAALSYFFESLALSYPNILTTMVHPGFVKTPLTDKNDFPMPMIASANSSAAAILKGIANGKREVNHPWLFTRILRLLGRMPIGLRRAIGKAMIKSQDS